MTTTNWSWDDYGIAPRPALAKRKRNAEVLFMEATRRGLIDRLKGILGSGPGSLAQLDLSRTTGEESQSGQAVPRTVALKDIRGSVNPGRTHDFDAVFRPLSKRSKERWIGIVNARRGGHRLPRISLIEAKGAYYVQDGHHRVSVANALGDSDIDANVTVWL